MASSDERERSNRRTEGDLEAQLLTLYADRERLHRELGTADPDEILAMIRSLEAQLDALYREKENTFVRRRGSNGSSNGRG
ncbi:MAG TPA: hypothetical protein RMH99_21695 [Sandaracinaceae bacterium LLY-WYZ-13_1]|nr:hypothetical protein [Sandaracinaceae bacterium LLY-WYZ-13_1]